MNSTITPQPPIKALALGRVSTKIQANDNHSLDAQRTSVDKKALELNCFIVKRWEMAVSSRKGKNLKRSDLKEARALCKKDKTIKYILLDKVNRLGREAKYLAYYMLELEFEHNVRLIFCDPSQVTLNDTDDPKAFLRTVEKLVESEVENEERISTTTTRMKARVLLGYYPFNPHLGYKCTPIADGLHVPDEPRYSLLRHALRAVSNLSMSPKEAQLWLRDNNFRTAKGSRVIDMYRFTTILKDPYYAGIIKINSWPVNEHGLHKPMITVEEYEINLQIASGRKIKNRRKHNPDFPLNLALHLPCEHIGGKITGINHTNGKGWHRKEYVCRICKKRMPQAETHRLFNEHLSDIALTYKGADVLKKALGTVWNKNESYRLDHVKELENQKHRLVTRKNDLIDAVVKNPDLSEDIKEQIYIVKGKISDLSLQIQQESSVDDDFKEFIFYAIDYVENLRCKWWSLNTQSLEECKQLLFNDEILIDQIGKVYTPNLSPIYTLKPNKKAPDHESDALLEELAGTAPASVSLSLLNRLQA